MIRKKKEFYADNGTMIEETSVVDAELTETLFEHEDPFLPLLFHAQLDLFRIVLRALKFDLRTSH